MLIKNKETLYLEFLLGRIKYSNELGLGYPGFGASAKIDLILVSKKMFRRERHLFELEW